MRILPRLRPSGGTLSTYKDSVVVSLLIKFRRSGSIAQTSALVYSYRALVKRRGTNALEGHRCMCRLN